MGIRYYRASLKKILLLLVMLLVGGLTLFGCARGSIPQGWSGIEVADGTLFLGSMKGEVVALNASSGARLWGKALEPSKQATGFGCAPVPTSVAIYGTPAVSGDLVYVGDYDGKVYAISSSTRLSTEKYLDESNPQPIVGGPVVAMGKVYIGCSDGKLYALEDTALNEEWKFETGDKIWSTPVIDGDTLYIGSFDKKLYAIDTTTGKEKWEKPFETDGAIAATPLVYDNTVYIGSFDRYLYAVNVTDGSRRWKSNFEAGSWFWAKPVAYNNAIYAGNLDGKVYVLDAKTGNKINEFDLGSPVSSSPVLVDSSIIIVSEEGKVCSIENNQKRELRNLEEKVYAPLSASDGVVYVHTQKHDTLYALNAQTGVVLWSLPLSSK